MNNIIWNTWIVRGQGSIVENCLSELEGEVISTVEGAEDGQETIITTESGKAIKIYHEQDCCEYVSIEDSEVDDIVGGYCHFAGFVDGETPVNNSTDDCYYEESQTWSFLKIETSKGSIWQRWLGESNGYYSESVDILGGVVEGSAAHKYLVTEN